MNEDEYDRALEQHSRQGKIDFTMLLIPGDVVWLETEYQEGFYRNYNCKHCDKIFPGGTYIHEVINHMSINHREEFVIARMAGL